MTAVSFENVSIIFGDNPNRALQMLSLIHI